jgi:hypothetical protein
LAFSQDIPGAGHILACSVYKKDKMKKRGDVKLHLEFQFEKNTNTAFQEHMHLIKNVVLHEIKISQVSRFCLNLECGNNHTNSKRMA